MNISLLLILLRDPQQSRKNYPVNSYKMYFSITALFKLTVVVAFNLHLLTANTEISYPAIGYTIIAGGSSIDMAGIL